MTTTNYVRDALLAMSERDRFLLMHVCHNATNRDPQNEQFITPVMFAIYCQLIDLEQDAKALAEQLEDLWRRS